MAPTYRRRNRFFVLWPDATMLVPSGRGQTYGETMELLDLQPPQYGVHTTGIYIIDDDGMQVLAGPFGFEIAAIAWIDQRDETLIRHHSECDSARD